MTMHYQDLLEIAHGVYVRQMAALVAAMAPDARTEPLVGVTTEDGGPLSSQDLLGHIRDRTAQGERMFAAALGLSLAQSFLGYNQLTREIQRLRSMLEDERAARARSKAAFRDPRPSYVDSWEEHVFRASVQ
jgi:hypothetical protein